MYFTSGSDRAFEQLMQGKPGFDHYDSGEAVTPEDCGTCRFYRPHWKYQFCVYAECPYQPGKLTAYDAVTFRVKGVENMAVFRVERNKGYTVMSNHHLRNKDLSLKAKGLLSQMLSLPEDWDYTLKGLSLINREQIDAIRAAIRELEQAGYIVRSRERDSQGRLRGADYVIYEQPQPVPDSPTLENPMLDNPTQEKPTLGKPTQVNQDISSKEKSILYHKTLTVGRVQTPTLNMLVDREAKISNFKKEKYHVVHIAAGGMEAASDRFLNPDDANATKTACAGAQAVCVSVKREKKTEQPPRLYDLTTLQREANRLFGFTAKQTLDYAQQLYEKKLLTYPRTDSQYLTDDMQPTAESIVFGLWPLLSFAAGLDIAPQFGRVLNSKKVSDHHAIIPTMEFVQKGFDGLTEGEKKLLSLVCCKLLCAVAAPHVYEAVTATFTCAGNEFTAKGKTILTPGWKEIERRFKASFKTDADEDVPELARELPEITEGQTFDPVEVSVTEHFTTPPKPYTEDTLLSAMERAGAEDMPEDAERQGLGTPATRASILEKLVQMGFVERKGKQLLPTKDGHNLVCVLPDVLTSPQLTAEWETKLTAIAKGEADPEGFMVGIEEMTRNLISRYSQISEDAQKLFQAERVVIGKCPRCGEAVYEGKKNYYCGNRACQFAMWKNDRFFEERGKTFTPKIAAALLKDGKAKVKGLRSMKTGKTYDGTVLLADTGGKYVNYRVEKKS